MGIAQSEAECQAIRVAAELIPGVQAVNDNLVSGLLKHGHSYRA